MSVEEIAPALSPEEWADLSAEREGAVIASRSGSIELDGPGPQDSVAIPISAFPALIALCNYELPEGDPRKFTHSDVSELFALAEFLDRQLTRLHGTEYPATFAYAVESLRDKAERLASYLPQKRAS